MLSQNYHILIVEDMAPDAMLVEYAIRETLPQCVFERVDARDAFARALAEFQPDAIVSDYNMPGFDGLTALRMALEHSPLTPVIIVTGSINEDTAVACLKAGAVDYVLKDSLKRLGPAVQHALEQKQINIERQNAQAALIASEERYRLLFETMAQGVVYQDADGQITSVNPAAERILGLTLAQMRGLTSMDPRWRTIHPDGSDFPGDTHPAMVTLRTGQEVRGVMMGIWHPAEERHRWVRVSAVPLFRDGDAAPDQVYATLADITELFESELQIRHLNAVLKAVRNINQLIVRERDRQRLLQAACENLTETRGFSSAYIVLFDAEKRLAFAAQSGWNEAFPNFLTLLASGERPYCVRQGLAGATGTLIEETSAICGVCPLAFSTGHKQEKKIIAPIRDAGSYYGLLTVALPPNLRIDPDELGLLDEVAGDLAFALRNLDVEDQRQQAEAALRDSETLFRNLFESHAAVKLLIDPETGQIVDANAAAVSYYGWSKAQLRQMRIQDINTLSPAEVQQQMEKARTLRRVHFEFRHRLADGSVRDVEVFSSAIAAQGRDLLHSIVHDVTERKRAEEALRETYEMLSALIHSSPLAIVALEPEGAVTLWNPAAEQMFGWREREALGQFPPFVPDEKRDEYQTLLDRVLQGEGLTNVEVRRRKQDGSSIDISISTSPLRDAQYQITGIMAVIADITERKRAEEELRQHREHLEELVKERTVTLEQEIAVRQRAEQELQDAKEQAEQANRAKSDFLANMSHDLRTPLNAVLGYAQILQEADNLTDRQRHGLETIHASGEHLLALINDILDLSKIEAGRLELAVDDIHLPTFLKNITHIIQVRTAQKGLDFVQECDAALPDGIRADETRLQEVLLNLLGNAVKFTERGRVTFRIVDVGFESADLEDAQQSKIKNLKFEIIDTGPGIAAEELERIFEPFQQAGAKRMNFGGTGLGLAISRRLVRLMGGELRVESVPGQGSRFWFEAAFPVAASAPVGKVPGQSQRIIGYAGPRRTILVADDEETNRNLLLNLLFPLDFRIVEAVNGQQCVEKAVKYTPNLILLDLRMPILDGFSATEQLRQIETLRNVPIIAVSASVFAETQQRARGIGFDDFLFKPVYHETLYALLQKYLKLDWIYAEHAEPPAEFQPPPEAQTVALLPMPDGERLYAAARRGSHRQVLEHLARIEQAGAEFRPLVSKLRILAQRFDTDAIVTILEDMGLKS